MIRWDDVADLYDLYVRTDFDVSFWREIAGSADGEVLELMAGTGRVSLSLLENGVRLVCVDISPAVVTKLADRGSIESTGIVTDVGLFLNLLAQRLCHDTEGGDGR